MPMWRCFHCNELFRDHAEAAHHFGLEIDSIPACKIAPDVRGLIAHIREQENELRKYRHEEIMSMHEFYALGAQHERDKRTEEEKGYARGIRDTARECMDIVIASTADNTVGSEIIKRIVEIFPSANQPEKI
jgi:hypothetical protein